MKTANASGPAGLENMVGASPAFRHMEKMIRRIAAFDTTVLIEGETGTGKELAARAIHYLSSRCGLPFVPINCGAIPDSLFENELFGHRRGAFTDARESHAGLVAQARGGTLFLDEVDALTSKAQVVLLRFIQDQEYRPLGSAQAELGNVRIIAATNADLPCLVAQGNFRADLLYRLNVLPLVIPPLREREGDVERLAEHYLNQFSRRYGLPKRALHPDTLAWMSRNAWPGNVRELENFIHRLVLLCDDAVISSQAPASDEERRRQADRRIPFKEAFGSDKARVIEDFERRFLVHVLQLAGGNVTQAAKLAGKERRALGKLLKKHSIDPQSFAG